MVCTGESCTYVQKRKDLLFGATSGLARVRNTREASISIMLQSNLTDVVFFCILSTLGIAA